MQDIHRFLIAAVAAVSLAMLAAPCFAQAETPAGGEALPPSAEAQTVDDDTGGEITAAVNAEEGQDEIPADLGQIDVDAEGQTGDLLPGPVAVESFPIELFQLSSAEDLTALDRIPWITNQDYFGGRALSLMGLSPKFTQILVDGKRVTGFIDQRLDASQLPLAGLERIEVIKGPLAPKYGSGAIAGVINLVTRKPGPNFELRSQTRAGSHGLNSQSLEFGKANQATEYFFSLQRRQRNSYDMNLRTVETDGDAYLSSSFTGKLAHKLNPEWSVSLEGSYLDEFSHNVQSAFGGFPRRGEFDTTRAGLSGSITYEPKANLAYTVSYNHSVYDHHMRSYFTTITPDQEEEDSFREGFSDIEFSVYTSSVRDVWQAGMLYNEDRLTSERIFDRRARLEARSAYIDWERYFGENSALSLGLRADDHSLTGLHISPKVSYWQRFSPEMDLRLGYGHGFRTPSIKELYFNYNSPYGYTVRGNPNLEPETANALTAVFTYTPSKKRSWEFGAFYEQVKGTITTTEILASPLVYKEVNLDKTRSQGLTLHHRRELGEKWFLNWDHALTDATDLDTGARLPLSPRYRSSLSLKYLFNEKNEVELLCSGTSPSYTAIENDRLAPGYVTLDMNWSFSTQWGDCSLSACNITDRTNRLYGPKPGREFFFGLTRKF